eukprot:COSAG05_NODE_74_length_21769_cov_194.316290_9_plen_105_part_00
MSTILPMFYDDDDDVCLKLGYVWVRYQVLGPLVDLIHFPGSDNPGDLPGVTMYYYPFLICFIGQTACVLLIVFFLEETLPPEKRKPFKADVFNSIKQFSVRENR